MGLMATAQRICNVTKNDTFVSDYFITSEKLVSVKTLLHVFCECKSLNILFSTYCHHLFHNEICQRQRHSSIITLVVWYSYCGTCLGEDNWDLHTDWFLQCPSTNWIRNFPVMLNGLLKGLLLVLQWVETISNLKGKQQTGLNIKESFNVFASLLNSYGCPF